MANIKINEISPDFSKELSGHWGAYAGKMIAEISDGTYSSSTDGVYKLSLTDIQFLNTKGTADAYLIREGVNTIFCVQPKVEARTFADYFPQMIPKKDPWLPGGEELAFPNFADRKVTKIEWLYVFAFSEKGKTEISDKLWEKFCKTLGKDKKFKEQLLSLSREDDLWNERTGWRGGLFYNGTLPELPYKDMIPDSIKDVWETVSGYIEIQGCVYHSGVIAKLKLQVPLVKSTGPLGGDVIKNITFATTFNAPVKAVAQFKPVETNDKKADDKKINIRQKREAALVGLIDFGNQNIEIKGVWPLDDDVFKIEVKSALKNMDTYFDQTSVFSKIVNKETEITTAIHISKKDKRPEAVYFDITAREWKLIEGIFSLDEVNFNCNIRHPGKLNIFTAGFSAKARIGDKVNVLCNGHYPDGEINLYLDPATPVLLTDILSVFGDDTGFAKDIAITRLGGKYDLATKYFAFGMTVAGTEWKAADDLKFKLKNLTLDVYGKDKYRFKLAAAFSYTFKTGKELIFQGSAEYDKSWRFSGNCETNLRVSDLAAEFGMAKKDVPSQLDQCEFRKLAFAFDGGTHLKYFGVEFEIELFGENINLALQVRKLDKDTYFAGDFKLYPDKGEVSAKDKEAARFKVEFIKQGTGKHKLGLQMLFNLAGVDIYLTAKSESDGKSDGKIADRQFSGGTKGLNIPLVQVLKQLLDDTFDIDFPTGFLPDLILNDIFISYDNKEKETNIIAFANIASKKIRFYLKYRSKTASTSAAYIFGIDTDVASLGGLPLVGDEMKDVKLSGVGFIYTSAAGKYKLPQLSKPVKDQVSTIVPSAEAAYEKGITLLANISLPGEEKPVALALPVNKQGKKSLLKKGADNIYLLAEPVPGFMPVVKWISINKKIGPVAVNKIGFGFADGQLSLLLSGGVTLAGLSLNVEGLGLSFSPAKLIKGENVEPKFNLQGLGLAFEKKPLEISGMLLRNEPAANESISFYGAAQIATSGFNIKGIGAYAKLNDAAKTDSLFIYGLYNGPIGGPSFFFVTGIAAGFGYNRTIRVPKLEEVKDFPLVSMVLGTGKKDTDILKDLIDNNWIPSSAGDYWMAVGIRFTSFKIIESFVLLTVKFGNKVEFAVIGLSLLKWPNKGHAIVYIELALLARFGPDSDVIAVTGMITPNSYLFDKNCKLTGGFAFYTWISGEHEGDFVITLGGYAPSYKIPAHYPVVDRLALNWKISDALSIRGEMYFALTPREIMAGGRWEIAYNLSFLSARVTIWADMYISWAPFHYELSAGIIVRIEANIKVLFVHIHFKLQMGCEVHIWGPPFAGEIYVDWSIFSFTIPFGAGGREKPAALRWDNSKLLKAGTGASDTDGFKESFIPVDKNKKMLVLDARIISGVINETVNDKKKDTKAAGGAAKEEVVAVNAYNLVIAVDSFFPVTDLYTVSNTKLKGVGASAGFSYEKMSDQTLMNIAGEDIPKILKDRETSFGIQPMEINKLTTELHVWLEKIVDEPDVKDKKAVKTIPVFDNVSIIGGAKGVNSALWAAGTAPAGGDTKNGNLKTKATEEEAVIKNVLSGVQIHIVEQEDKTIEIVPVKDLYYNIAEDIDIPLLRGNNPASQEADTKEMISKALINSKAGTTVDKLRELGFDELYVNHEKLLFNEILSVPPVNIASIGQLLPPEIIA